MSRLKDEEERRPRRTVLESNTTNEKRILPLTSSLVPHGLRGAGKLSNSRSSKRHYQIQTITAQIPDLRTISRYKLCLRIPCSQRLCPCLRLRLRLRLRLAAFLGLHTIHLLQQILDASLSIVHTEPSGLFGFLERVCWITEFF